MTIVNFMPVSGRAPVSVDVLRDHLDEAARRAGEEDVTLLVPKGASDLAEKLPSGRVVLADDSFGYVYTNDTAALQVVRGEKPLPSEVTGSCETAVVSGERWLLGNDEKRVYVGETCVSVPARTTVAAILSAAGVSADGVKAVYLGYPQCQFVVASSFGDELEVSADELRVYTNENCMAKALSDILGEFRHEACGRCVFGNEGGHQMATILADICNGKGNPGDLDLIRDLGPVMEEQALCEVGRKMAAVALSALDLFGDEIGAHITKKQCPAGECRAFLTYHILVSRCVGCGKCLDVCEEDAIMGKPNFVHVVDQKACVRCGRCLEACPEGAVVTAGAKKPKTPPKPIPCRVHK
jgi:NADH-quinone oxidoreductase subunit F